MDPRAARMKFFEKPRILKILHNPSYVIPCYGTLVYQGHAGFLVSTVGQCLGPMQCVSRPSDKERHDSCSYCYLSLLLLLLGNGIIVVIPVVLTVIITFATNIWVVLLSLSFLSF